MSSFEEQVGGFLSQMGANEQATRAAQLNHQERYRRKVAHLRRLGTDASAYLRDKGIRPIPLLRYRSELSSDSAANYRSAFIGTKAWYMGRLSLTQEGVLVGGHKPFQSTGEHAAAELRRIGINAGDWYIPHENPIEVRENGPAQLPLSDRWGQPDEFEVYIHAHEDEMKLSDLVARCTAELISGGPEFNAATYERLSRYE
jgi:hypothetical protein